LAKSKTEQEPLANDIYSAMQRILDSGAIGAKSRSREVLQYIITEELENRGQRLKAYSIGVDVLGRSIDFEPNTDSIVRVEVARLRQSLDGYYTGVGAQDGLVISIPKGSYRPAFSYVKPERSAIKVNTWHRRLAPFIAFGAVVISLLGISNRFIMSSQDDKQATSPMAVSIAVTEGTNLASNSEGNAAQAYLVQRLRAALSRNSTVSIVPSNFNSSGGSAAPIFEIQGSVQSAAEQSRFSVEITNVATKALVWARTYPINPDNSDGAQDQIVDVLARELHPQVFSAFKQVLEKRDPETLSAQELFVLATWVPGQARSTLAWEQERLRLARMAIEKDPDYGPAYSVLADKLSYLAEMDAQLDLPKAREEAKASLNKALDLAPGDANSMLNVGIAYWHLGENANGVRAMKRVLELDPNHGFAEMLAQVLPYTCTPPPQTVIDATAAFDQSLGRDNPVRWVSLTWLGMLHLNRGEYEQALDAEQHGYQIFHTPDTVMRQAVILNRLGRTNEADALIREEKRNWPNIDPRHFSETTMPRRCGEFPDASKLLKAYSDLAEAMATRLAE